MPAQLTPGRFTLDPAASTVRLSHKTMWGLATVKGGFGRLSGSGELGADGTASGTLSVDADSIDTANAKRDKHLRSADFFDVERFPQITFAASSVKQSGDGTALVEGELTVRGTSRKLSFPLRYEAEGTEAVVLRGSVPVSRTDYGLAWNQLGMIKGPATMELELRFTSAR